MTVIGIGIGIENNAAVEHRQYAFFAGLHFLVPQLQLAAPILFPVFVQVDKHIDPPLPVAVMRVDGEVGMDIQESAAGGLVDTAALEPFVLLKVADPGDRAQPLQEGRELQLVDRRLDRFGKQIDLVQSAFVFVVVLIVDPAIGFI